ncbi:hypothetical protein Cgig2_013174 [Carnegiea gigantea]|uniref:RNase H type-1 domain-containing protein n=1 Tax=Carnegiea gigantea TaxID=171969 RepID=A0A9Q1GW97_9CARY|nr:hypothetical protein Cgig2_013174 [Carnegiea gigantea]
MGVEVAPLTFIIQSYYAIINKIDSIMHPLDFWKLELPPRIKMFLWCACIHALPTKKYTGFWKVDFDGATLGDWGHGRSMVVQGSMRNGIGFRGPEVEEPGACLFAMQKAQEFLYNRGVCEGDCMRLIIEEILKLSLCFEFCSFSYAKRMGNGVAHALAHLQPYDLSYQVWLGDGLDFVLDLAPKDLCVNPDE